MALPAAQLIDQQCHGARARSECDVRRDLFAKLQHAGTEPVHRRSIRAGSSAVSHLIGYGDAMFRTATVSGDIDELKWWRVRQVFSARRFGGWREGRG